MAKGYVLVDIPESCSECQLCSYDDMHGYLAFVCCGKIDNGFGFVGIPEEIINNNLKPDWCPIKEFPEEKYERSGFKEEDYMNCGYNLCLEDILGDEMNELN